MGHMFRAKLKSVINLFYNRLCTINEGRVAIGDLKSGFMPCTPFGCIELIKRYI